MQILKQSMVFWVAGILFFCFSSGALPQNVRIHLTEYRDPVTGMEFVLVKGGCYEMGDTFGDATLKHEKPVHEVCVDDIYLGKYEVTVGEFRMFVTDSGYRTEAERGDGCSVYDTWKKEGDKNWRNPGFPQDDRHPVVCVSWNDSKAFADWLKSKTGSP